MPLSRARALFIAAVFIYGTIGPFVRFIDAPSEVVVLIRGIVGAATIAAAIALTGRGLDVRGIRANAGWLVGTGLCLGFNWVALFAAYRWTSIAVASVCNYTAPVIFMLLAMPIFHERVTVFKLGCAAVALLGVVLVSGVVGADPASFDPVGIGLGMLSAAGFVGIVICNRFVEDVDTFSRVLVQLACAAAVALVYVLWTHGGVPLPVDATSWAFALLLGIVHTGFAYILWFGAQSHLPLAEVALLGYLEPVMSVVLSAIVLGEPLTGLGIAGAALVLGAAATSEIVQS